MGDQGAGGGLDSHMPTHRRQDSSEEPISAETVAETRNPAPEPDQKETMSQTLELPRPRVLTSGGTNPGTPVTELSRQSSSCSTSSHVRNTEYLTAQTTERRPSPLSRYSAPFSNRPLEPPVTKTTLSELDVHKIIHNPKLRHDINFDPELHFRPNLDGEKGRRKQDKANQFWSTLTDQLLQFVMDRDGFLQKYGDSGDWCLPSLLRAVKEIIQTLVPQRDRDLLNEGLNVELLMQQFYRGVADLEKLALWLSGVLKLHCAPMRDEWVDEMYNELSNGNRNNDVDELVKGMRSLLSVLEAMKLDVANHQIRCLRPVLIDDTVNFEQRFFVKKIQGGRLDISRATAWYKEAQAYAALSYGNGPIPHLQAFGETAIFFEAVSRLVLPSTSTDNVPSTFLFDEERIIKLRADMYDSICLEICMRKFEDLEPLSGVTQAYHRVPAYVSEGSSGSGRSSLEFNFNTSRPSSLALSDRGSATSSPRSSGGLFVHPVADLAESRAKAHSLYNSLLALLHTASPASRPSQKWQSLAQPVALQILRYVNAPHSLPGFENQLATALTDIQGQVFREVELQFQQRLLGELAKRVKEFKNLSGVGLFSVATGGRVHGTSRGWDSSRDRDQRDSVMFDGIGSRSEPRDEAGIEDMATRLTHLGILHWRVWAQLAYQVDIGGEFSASSAPCTT
ncbi:T-complex protein 11-domain-containing protein [Lasiosphaeris hirsuta]|uniref:T-complex protein 11-domain-containing protein n=1 Tax=Lasiosphaeris hirsuta TaxID=260670 RepID=A0AA39ZWP8_9PEZI|nr:T-complex protein 11-domain-containing protein [Lasiosphaeris hirsuta]